MSRLGYHVVSRAAFTDFSAISTLKLQHGDRVQQDHELCSSCLRLLRCSLHAVDGRVRCRGLLDIPLLRGGDDLAHAS